MWKHWLDGTLLKKDADFEAKHPRQNDMGGRGGKFAKKPVRSNDIDRIYTSLGENPYSSFIFQNASEVLAMTNPENGLSLFAIGKDRAGQRINISHGQMLYRMDSGKKHLSKDEAENADSYDEQDKWVRGYFRKKGTEWELHLDTEYAAATNYELDEWNVDREKALFNVGVMMGALRSLHFPNDLPIRVQHGKLNAREVISVTLNS